MREMDIEDKVKQYYQVELCPQASLEINKKPEWVEPISEGLTLILMSLNTLS